jgi:hypothetical protein
VEVVELEVDLRFFELATSTWSGPVASCHAEARAALAEPEQQVPLAAGAELVAASWL